MEGLRNPIRMVLEGVEGVVLLALAIVSWPVSRRWLTDLGATSDERASAWPGDRVLPSVDARTTRAVSIRAPVAEVWPWIVQFGLDRGGFHSYELLERVGGIDVRNVERVLPDLQDLSIGQEIKLHPRQPGLFVTEIESNERLCMRTWRDEDDLTDRDPAIAGSFSFYLVRESNRACRLLVRTCKHRRRPAGLGPRLVVRFVEAPLDLVMEQRMLRTVRRLAERRRD